MDIRKFIIDTLEHFSLNYKIKLNNNILNPVKTEMKNDALFNNSGIAAIYEDMVNDNNTSRYHTLCTIQKCVRLDDINEVHKSNLHSACFYMIGIFGIRKFSTEKIIKDIYNFITSIVNKNEIYFTVHSKDEFFTPLLKQIDSSIEIKIDNGNYWSSGKVGLCGYCCEIIHRAQNIEIWNIVHITHSRDNYGNLYKLKNYKIDTGGGLERLLMLKYGASSLYDLPEYKKIIDTFGDSKEIKLSIDCIKLIDAMCYSNIPITSTQQGYVFRKILRKLILLLRKLSIPLYLFIYECRFLLSEYITILIITEKEKFLTEKCLKKFYEQTKDLNAITEEKAIDLHETYGISLSIIEYLAKENNIKMLFQFNEDELMKKISKVQDQKQQLDLENYDKNFHNTFFTSEKYELNVTRESFLLLDEKYNIVYSNEIEKDKIYYILPSISNVYAESGGQISDKFNIKNDNKIIFKGLDAIKNNQYTLLKLKCTNSVLLNTNIIIEVDYDHRKRVSQHHSLTHIIMYILSKIICTKVIQVSSKIYYNKCRLSVFSYYQLFLNKQELESLINNILKNEKLGVVTARLAFSYAKNIFRRISHKKYPSYVRTITIYSPTINSKEICNGTHNTDFNHSITNEFNGVQINSLNSSDNHKHVINIVFSLI